MERSRVEHAYPIVAFVDHGEASFPNLMASLVVANGIRAGRPPRLRRLWLTVHVVRLMGGLVSGESMVVVKVENQRSFYG